MGGIVSKIKSCELCKDSLEPNPVFQFNADAKILIIGQAPGIKVHTSNIPFNDKSGDRLRSWMGIDRDVFYSTDIAIVPMAFCYPGKGKSGDKAPPKICAQTHHKSLIDSFNDLQLILLIVSYAQSYYCSDNRSLTERVMHFEEYLPHYFVLPHPSPRNNIWLKRNDWFEKTALSVLQSNVSQILGVNK